MIMREDIDPMWSSDDVALFAATVGAVQLAIKETALKYGRQNHAVLPLLAKGALIGVKGLILEAGIAADKSSVIAFSHWSEMLQRERDELPDQCRAFHHDLPREGLMIPSSFSGRTVVLASTIFDMPVQQIMRRERFRKTVRARQAVMHTLRDVRMMSFPTIGRLFGYDHTTVMHGIMAAANVADNDLAFRLKLHALNAEARLINAEIKRVTYNRIIDHTNLPLRIYTTEVCGLAGYGPAKLRQMVDDGKMPPPVARGGQKLYERDAVLLALGLIKEAPEAAVQW
jgi:hypothetical protein